MGHDAERLKAGRFYTPPGLVDLVLGLALRSPDDRIWDPTCGDGAFLRGAARRGMTSLWGTDRDGEALRAIDVEAELRCTDLFELEPADLPAFDAIVGNPPFVRVERLEPAERRRLRERVGAALPIPLPAQADLSLLALLHCARFLAPGGRLAFVMPNTVLDARFGASVRDHLLRSVGLRAVVESRVEAWFPEVSLNTAVVLLERSERASFVQLARPADGGAAQEVLGGAGRSWPLARVEGTRWTEPLRAPDVWFDVLDRAELGSPEAFIELRYGLKPGITDFFAPAGGLPVEDAFKRPFLRSLRGVDGYVLQPSDANAELLFWEGDPPEGPGLRRWIERGEAQRSRSGVPWPAVPSVRGNQPWYRLRSAPTGDVVLPQFRHARHAVHANPHGLPVNNSAWWGRFLDPAWRELGTALLNSSWAALAAEVRGRTNLGEGLLTCYGPDFAALPLPHPGRLDGAAVVEAWRALRTRRALPFPDEAQRPDRRALDAAVFAALGLPDPAIAAAVRQGAVDLLELRLGRARALRQARRG